MPHVEDSFEELRSKLKSQERLLERSGEPIYYLVFGQREMQLVKRRFPIWKEKLEKQDGWRVHEPPWVSGSRSSCARTGACRHGWSTSGTNWVTTRPCARPWSRSWRIQAW